MRQAAIILGLVIWTISGFSQNFRKVDRFVHQISKKDIVSVDTLRMLIENNFSREPDRLRAIYGWICSNITYDIDRMANPLSYSSDSAVRGTLSKRKAICSGYVDLFIAISRELGIKAHYISGYTKQNGVVVDLEHAWVAARLANGQWKLFDPTWGASEWVNGELVKRVSYDYFMVEPVEFIKTHMPFDPMWQLLYQPIKTDEFYGQKLSKDDDYLFNYNDTIRDYQVLSESRMFSNLMRRMEWAGIKNEAAKRYFSMTEKYYHLALQSEEQAQRDLWLYAFDQQTKNYRTSLEMYEQLKGLLGDYKQRGVSVEQLIYSSTVLIRHTDDCLAALSKLRTDKYADVELLDGLKDKVENIFDLVKNQNMSVRRLGK
ncbi:transglutaminase domain-containing protein [Alistipes sp. ZOR0009]|uniref:transglutaminase domain-containing protein n=1 Tax=Alistipes sp. ZOR0009 TaxID=1339253 RepID=UPI00064810E3|nr:transglutaminase-like domain-containing protein [Alistipes sp. ZOR0009]